MEYNISSKTGEERKDRLNMTDKDMGGHERQQRMQEISSVESAYSWLQIPAYRCCLKGEYGLQILEKRTNAHIVPERIIAAYGHQPLTK